jgi:peptide chain release factor 2
MKKIGALKVVIEPWKELESEIQDNLDLAELLKEEGKSEGPDVESLSELTDELKKRLEAMELRALLNGEEDNLPCFLQIHAGAGGTESQDWASMLLRMYMRWAESKDYKIEQIDFSEGDTAGIKDVTLRIEGPYAYGYLKAEAGVHRLVRISPFDSNARRHTSFASVSTSPEVDETIEVNIGEKDKDWRIDSFRSGGKGGQKVNKTTSAVRITHYPTGIVVQCQNERSWHQNRDLAFQVLRSRLYAHELELRKQATDAKEAAKSDINFGSQIRSYVLHPYQMVNDHRMELKISDADSVLEGDIDPFIEGYLKSKLSEKSRAS